MKFAMNHNTAWIGFYLGILYLALAFAFFPDFMGDDSFIHLEFAKNIANGNGFSFSGNTTYGSTAPLWTILTAILLKLGLNGVWAIRLLNAVFSFLLIFFSYQFCIKNFTFKGLSVFISIVFFNAFMWRWSISGMESSIAALGILFMIDVSKNLQKYTPTIIGISCGLLILIRPEFLLFSAILGTFIIFSKKLKFNQKILFSLSGALVVGLWALYAYSVFGSIVPNTFLSKDSNAYFESYDNILRNFGVILFTYFGLIIFLILRLLPFKKIIFSIKNIDLALLFSSFSLLGFYGYYLSKDVIILSRYSLILLPATAYLAAFIAEKISLKRIGVGIFFSIAFQITFLNKIVIPDANKFVDGFQSKFKEIAQILNDKELKNYSVAVNDVGIIGFYTQAQILDLAGLTSPERFQFEKKSDFIIINNPDFIIWRNDFSLSELEEFIENYEIIYQTTLPSLGIQQSNIIELKLFAKKEIPNN